MNNTDKIIIVGGLPRTGKSILRNSIGSHSQIAFTPTGFNYFGIFSEDRYNHRGSFNDNINFFINDHWQAKKWGINEIEPDINGNSRKDLYMSILELYRNKYWPERKYIGTYIHNSEEYFDVLIDWFGYKRLKFIHIIRDPYDNYSSYVISRKVDLKLRSPHIFNSSVNKFCNMWAQSAAIGLNGAIKYPESYRTIFFEDLISKPDNYMASLCDWIGIPYEKDRMLNMIDYPVKQNSAFSSVEKRNKPIYKDNYDRKSVLSPYEIETIKTMACTNFISALDYRKEKHIVNWKIKTVNRLNINEYSQIIRSVKKTLVSPFGLKQTFLFYLRELFVFDNIKNIISVLIFFIKSKINK